MRDDIDGVWTGYYTHHRGRYGITARFAPAGGELLGAMTDAVLTFEYTLAELLDRGDLAPGQADALVAAIRKHLPAARAADVRLLSALPPAAELTGYVQGPVVRFRKQYCGDGWAGWRVGEAYFGGGRPGHAVEYEGELSADGGRIAGRWWIPADPAAGARETEGTFELRRGR